MEKKFFEVNYRTISGWRSRWYHGTEEKVRTHIARYLKYDKIEVKEQNRAAALMAMCMFSKEIKEVI